ncbi:hypothetical protein JXA88_00895 [Candidatus Fermentibacteria bacterium]|nr:hypothetical protein [Candidatus Fermentibacteria bacterium]
MPFFFRPLAFALILCLALVSCGKESTAPPPAPVSVLSFIGEVFDAHYVSGAEMPASTVPASLHVVTADSALGQGSTFSITLSHPRGVKEIIVGAVDAVGYFLIPADSMNTETRVRGRLSTANREDFAFRCGARGVDGSVLAPAQHGIDVLSGESVGYYIKEVVGATYVDEELPTPTAGVTITNVVGDSVIINGGSMEVTLTCSVPATAVVVGVPNARGYFRLPTTGLPGEVSMVILISQSAAGSFVLQFMSEEPGPAYGVVARFNPTLIRVGSGDVQVSLSFRPSQDVDLYLVEPTGEEIYYANPVSASGGVLDLDSNAACQQDHVNNENITYDTGTPPSGEYVVRVNYWMSCDGGGADFRVVVAVRGEVQMYSGSFEASEAHGGGQGSGREICRFVF